MNGQTMKTYKYAIGSIGLQIIGAAFAIVIPVHAQSSFDSPAVSDSPIRNERSALWPYSALLAKEEAAPANALDRLSLGNEVSLHDFILGPEVFSKAKEDLSDLRLFDAAGKSIPFSLRVLSPQKIQQAVSASEFDRDESPKRIHQLTLDLLQNEIQHNEIKIETTGDNFRRRVDVDGSDDRSKWRPLTSGKLIRFTQDSQKINIDTLSYPDSRFRYIRVSVLLDPDDSSSDNVTDDFRFKAVSVLREVDLPGEQITTEASVGARQGVRSAGSAGSAWIIDLGGENIPCERIEVDIADKQFVRDISIQAEQSYGPLGKKSFSTIYGPYGTTWQRKPGDAPSPMVASFSEIRTSRLRLQVTDYRNAPLTIRSVKFSASVRQVVFDRTDLKDSEVRLYFGNTDAEAPNYDFARNLPQDLDPSPERGRLLSMEINPAFVAPPKVFLERFPWFIYVVLAAVTIALAIVIASLARTAITLHDTVWTEMGTEANN